MQTHEPIRQLLARAFHSTLHRLRGLRALLGGWIEIGVPPGSEERVRDRLGEDMTLLARLDWLGSMLFLTPPLQRLEAGEAPSVLLAVALGFGSPEEARERLPVILAPRAGLALALYLQNRAPEAVLGHDLQLRWEGRSLVVDFAAPSPSGAAEPEAELAEFLLRHEPQTLAFRPGLFAPAASAGGEHEGLAQL